MNKIKTRVSNIVSRLDSHVHSAQVAFKMCREGMVLCDEEVRGPAGGGIKDKDLAPTEARTIAPKGSEAPRLDLIIGKGSNAPGGSGVDSEGWDVDIDPDEADDFGGPAPLDAHHAHGTSGHHFLLHFARQGLELARGTEEAFNEVRQEAYKVCLSQSIKQRRDVDERLLDRSEDKG